MAASMTTIERDTVIALATTASSAAIIAVSSGFHAAKLWKQVLSKRKDSYDEITANLYQDEDGVATLDSEARYSTYMQKVFILLGTVAGMGFSLLIAIRSTGSRQDLEFISNWLVFFSWVNTPLINSFENILKYRDNLINAIK